MSKHLEPEGGAPAETDPETSAMAAESAPKPAGRPKAGLGTIATRAQALPVALGALCVIAAVVAGLQGWHAISDATQERDAAEALDAARTRAVLVLTYTPQTIDTDIAKARAQLSGTFAAQFEQLVNTVVVPASKQQGLASTVDVTHAALISSHPENADVLLLMHQVVTSTAEPKQEGTIQVRVTMTRAPDHQWLISNLQPI